MGADTGEHLHELGERQTAQIQRRGDAPETGLPGRRLPVQACRESGRSADR